MTEAEKLIKIAEKEQKVYNAGYEKGKSEGGDTTEAYEQGVEDGKQAEYDRFWDAFQNYGNREGYSSAFSGLYWTPDTLRPKYTCRVVGSGSSMFNKCWFKEGLTHAETKTLIDTSNISVDVSKATACDYMYANARVSHATLIFSEKVTNLSYAFTKNNQAQVSGMRITLLVPNPTCKWDNAFSYHNYLSRLVLLEGTVIGVNGFNVSWSTYLSHDDLVGILNALEDKSGDTSGTTWKVTIGSTNKAKLTDDELEIAYEKGWTVS